MSGSPNWVEKVDAIARMVLFEAEDGIRSSATSEDEAICMYCDEYGVGVGTRRFGRIKKMSQAGWEMVIALDDRKS